MTRSSTSLLQRYTTMSDFPVIENPAKLKVVELKEELDKRGLPVGGLKKDVRPFSKSRDTLAARLAPVLALIPSSWLD
jgi:hypothetical protein